MNPHMNELSWCTIKTNCQTNVNLNPIFPATKPVVPAAKPVSVTSAMPTSTLVFTKPQDVAQPHFAASSLVASGKAKQRLPHGKGGSLDNMSELKILGQEVSISHPVFLGIPIRTKTTT